MPKNRNIRIKIKEVLYTDLNIAEVLIPFATSKIIITIFIFFVPFYEDRT